MKIESEKIKKEIIECLNLGMDYDETKEAVKPKYKLSWSTFVHIYTGAREEIIAQKTHIKKNKNK